MRISEAYEHEPILAYSGEDCCPVSGCGRIGTQCVNVSAAMTMTPVAAVGTIAVTCQGLPTIACVPAEDGSFCTLTMTQQVCVSVPIRYGVTLTSGETTIGCADHCIGSGGC